MLSSANIQDKKDVQDLRLELEDTDLTGPKLAQLKSAHHELALLCRFGDPATIKVLADAISPHIKKLAFVERLEGVPVDESDLDAIGHITVKVAQNNYSKDFAELIQKCTELESLTLKFELRCGLYAWQYFFLDVKEAGDKKSDVLSVPKAICGLKKLKELTIIPYCFEPERGDFPVGISVSLEPFLKTMLDKENWLNTLTITNGVIDIDRLDLYLDQLSQQKTSCKINLPHLRVTLKTEEYMNSQIASQKIESLILKLQKCNSIVISDVRICPYLSGFPKEIRGSLIATSMQNPLNAYDTYNARINTERPKCHVSTLVIQKAIGVADAKSPQPSSPMPAESQSQPQPQQQTATVPVTLLHQLPSSLSATQDATRAFAL